MLTNVFRLGGLQQLSWFQLIPIDEDDTLPFEKREALARKVLSAHVRLQNEGHLSAWTHDTVLLHEAPASLKLWLFLPGRIENINPLIQSTISGLRVSGSGLWSFPKDSGEIGTILCQALQNRIERGLRSVGYLRFGDVFVKCKTFTSSDPQLRRPLAACEVVFTASEEAIFIHVLLLRRRVRTLCTEDMQAALRLHSCSFGGEEGAQTVIVAPHGLSGKLTGCYSGDLVQGLYESKHKSVTGHLSTELPLHMVPSYNGVHAEIYFGHNSNVSPFSSSATMLSTASRSLKSEQNTGDTAAVTTDRGGETSAKSSYQFERILLYPPEAVLVPFVPLVPARTFLKRSWMQSWTGKPWIEEEVQAVLKSGSGCSSRVYKADSHDRLDNVPTTNLSFGVKSPSSKSSSSSTSSSDGSSIENSSSHCSGTSSDTDAGGGVPGELEADAESLVAKGNTFKQAQVSTGQPTDDGLDDVKGFEAANRTAHGSYLSYLATSDWPEEDRGLGMGIENDADILAEFGDFGDFFEDDSLAFGEPPGTAESQSMMFQLPDCVEGITSPGNGFLDSSDPMLLPILEIPDLEGLGQQAFGKDDKVSGVVCEFQKDIQVDNKSPEAPPDIQNIGVDSLTKTESMVLLAPGFDPVSFPSGRDVYQHFVFKSPYLPQIRKDQVNSNGTSDLYVYRATPPSSPKSGTLEKKHEHYDNISDRDVSSRKRVKIAYAVNYTKGMLTASRGMLSIEPSTQTGSKWPLKASPGVEGEATYLYGSNFNLPRRSLATMLATDVECYVMQITLTQVRDADALRKLLPMSVTQYSTMGSKESSDVFYSADSIHASKVSAKQQQERKKKDRIPSRIAGDVDEEVQDGPPVSLVGVWRPVGAPKPQKAPHANWNETTHASSGITSTDSRILSSSGNVVSASSTKPTYWQELLDSIPLLIQQAAVSFDVAFDGDCGDGPFGWLISQEQERHKHICGPSSTHAACGGALSISHFLDNAGIELLDPLSSEISAASVAALLQSDIRLALSTAFEDAHLDGPLSLGEWLRGRAILGDSLASDTLPSESKETVSTLTIGMGEPITPPQCTTGGASAVKQDAEIQACDGHRSNNSWTMEGSSLSDDGCSRRCGQEAGSIESDTQSGSFRGGPTVVALPIPSLLVGYQDDWLKVSSSALHLWEKAPFEPYATAKPVIYHVVCPQVNSLLLATVDYLQQLSSVYEACKLGTHVAGNSVFGQGGFTTTSAKHAFSGFTIIDFPTQGSQINLQSNAATTPLNQYVMNFNKIWNANEYRKAFQKACKALPISASSTVQREPETSPSLVYYLICPSSDPDIILQTMVDACQIIGHNLALSEKERKASQAQRSFAGSGLTDDYSSATSQGIVGFATSKLVLQVLTAETVFKSSRPISMEIDSLKEVAFTIYNKVRRIPRGSNGSDLSLHTTHLGRGRALLLQSGAALPGVWKDCNTVRSSATGAALLGQDSLLDSNSFRTNNWDNAWQQQGNASEANILTNLDGKFSLDSTTRYLFEPLFILAEPGSIDNGVGLSASRSVVHDETSASGHPGSAETMHGTVTDSGSEFDITGNGTAKVANLHCCYGWTEDLKWLISVWTDARGELLDVHLFPVTGGQWELKGLHSLFVQVLLLGCQLLTMATGVGASKLRSLVISRIGAFFEAECQEWQKALFTVGGLEFKKWPVQIWQLPPDNNIGTSSGLQPQDVSSLAERNLPLGNSIPSSPGPSSSVFTSRNKPLNLVKPEIGSSTARKQGGAGHGQHDGFRGSFHLLQSISFISVMQEHSLQIVGPSDTGPQAGVPQSILSPNWLSSNNTHMLGSLGTGVGLIKTLASTAASYLFIPAHGARFLSPLPFHLPAGHASESLLIGQLPHKKSLTTPLACAFIVSRAVSSARTESLQKSMEEWPSTLSIGLVGHMSSCSSSVSQLGQNSAAGVDAGLKTKATKPGQADSWDQAADIQSVLESLAAELHALSWLTSSPAFPYRRTALPFHCDILQRLRRLLHYADDEIGGLQDT